MSKLICFTKNYNNNKCIRYVVSYKTLYPLDEKALEQQMYLMGRFINEMLEVNNITNENDVIISFAKRS